MTQPDFIKSRLPFINAMAEGKTVECRFSSIRTATWGEVSDSLTLMDANYELRIKPTPEEERLAKYRALYEEWKREGFKLEWKRTGWLQWHNEPDPDYMFALILKENRTDLECRRKPAPSSTPWSLHKHPDGVVWVRRKGMDTQWMLVTWTIRGAQLSEGSQIDYHVLLRDFEQLDGSACGEEAK